MLKFNATREQANELRGLAYHQANHQYRLELVKCRGDESITAADLENDRKNIEFYFPILDELGVPFWVQNTVLCWAEDWRRYQTEYFSVAMEKRNIYLQ